MLAVWGLSRLVNWREVAAVIQKTPLERLAAAVLFYLLAAGARALAWRAILQNGATLRRTFFAIEEGYLLNNLLPFRLGELGRAVLLGRHVTQGPLYVLSTIAIERVYDLALAASFLLLSLPFLFALAQASLLAITTLALTVGALLLFYTLARHGQHVQGWLYSWLGERWAWMDRLLAKAGDILAGFGALTSPRSFSLSLFWMLLCWLLLAAEYYVLLQWFAPHASLWWAIFALSIGMLGAALPSVPSSLGVYEASLVGALALFNVPFAAALSFAITLHLIHILLSGLLGLWGLAQEQETLLGLYRRIQGLLRR